MPAPSTTRPGPTSPDSTIAGLAPIPESTSTSEALVPALTVVNPTVAVSPSTNLKDGQVVEVRVTGFGVGGKVLLSECASAAAATDLGCGSELASQPFLVADDSRSGSTSFVVHASAPGRALSASPTSRCTSQCVVVATVGAGYAYAVASIAFEAP